MTAAFDEFMRQYKMTGSEKADGYSRNAFVGLDESEKNEVFRLLLNELPFSVEWLFLVDPKKALNVVKSSEEEWRGDSYKHVYMLQEQIIKYTGDLSYRQRMVEDYDGYVEYIRPLVVDSISRVPASTITVDLLKKIIMTETNDDAVDRAARGLLKLVKVPRDSEVAEKNYKRLISELCSESSQVKMRALREVDKFGKHLLTDWH